MGVAFCFRNEIIEECSPSAIFFSARFLLSFASGKGRFNLEEICFANQNALLTGWQVNFYYVWHP